MPALKIRTTHGRITCASGCCRSIDAGRLNLSEQEPQRAQSRHRGTELTLPGARCVSFAISVAHQENGLPGTDRAFLLRTAIAMSQFDSRRYQRHAVLIPRTGINSLSP